MNSYNWVFMKFKEQSWQVLPGLGSDRLLYRYRINKKFVYKDFHFYILHSVLHEVENKQIL